VNRAGAELVANGATGALARVDDGRHTYRMANGAARLEPRQPLTPAARFRAGSGMFNYTDDPTFFDRDPTAPVTRQELVAIATKHPPTFRPGRAGPTRTLDTSWSA
jgi:hypothetical protein